MGYVSHGLWLNANTCDRSVVEAAVCVICGSIPTLPAFFRRYPPNFSRITKALRSILWGRSKKENQDQPDVSRAPLPTLTKPQKLQIETRVLGSIKG